MPNEFFTADTHFSHVRCATEWRKFASAEEHDEHLIQQWNATVSPKDTVIHVGDVAMGHLASSIHILGRLNGTLHLVLGNHDRLAIRYGHRKAELKWEPEYFRYFKTIGYSMPWTLRGKPALIHHYPLGTEARNPKPTDGNFEYLIHGHVHDAWTYKVQEGIQMINVGVDVWDFTPVPVDLLAQRL